MSDHTPQLPLFTIVRDDLPPIIPITSPKVKDWTGRVFGRLTVLGFAGPGKKWQSRWVCHCACGKLAVVAGPSLKSGEAQSCGCLHSDVTAKRNKTHGLSDRPEYKIYRDIVGRCENPKRKCYADYGGRGIAICQHWRESFANFFADMGPRPSKSHSIDRIDTNAHYSCGHCRQCKQHGWVANCRWATRVEQANNTRRNHWIEYSGETLTMSQWARRVGLTPDQLQKRLSLGWSVERALTQPLYPPGKYRR